MSLHSHLEGPIRIAAPLPFYHKGLYDYFDLLVVIPNNITNSHINTEHELMVSEAD